MMQYVRHAVLELDYVSPFDVPNKETLLFPTHYHADDIFR